MTNPIDNALVSSHPILLFDGVCNFCDSSANLIIGLDKNARFRFTTLQSDVGQAILGKHQLATNDFDSVVVVHKDKFYLKSDAALKVFEELGGLWSLLSLLKIIPKSIRDSAYDILARNRYNWFGKKDQCMIPTPELKAKFLE